MSPRRPKPGLAVRVARMPHAAGLALPSPQSAGAAGLDLQAAIDPRTPLVIAPGARALVPTGFAFELPVGYEAQVRPRSGLALHHGIAVLNSPGTIDADYRGEVQVIVINLGGATFEIRRADRIAQLVIQPVVMARLVETRQIEATPRGPAGFGSTGLAAAASPKKKKAVAKRPKPAKTAAARGRQDKPRHRE